MGDLSFEILDETFTQVKVRYYDVDNKVYLSEDDFVAANTKFGISIGTKDAIPFQYDTNSTENISYVVSQSGKTVFTGGSGAANFAFNGGNASTNYTDANYVEVQITGLSKLSARYKVTGLNDTLGDLFDYAGATTLTDNVTINIAPSASSVDGNSTVPAGGSTAWTVTTIGQINGGDVGLKISFNTGDTVTINNQNQAATITDANGKTQTSLTPVENINADFQLAITNVEVLSAPKVLSARFVDTDHSNTLNVGDHIYVTFNQNVDITGGKGSATYDTTFVTNNKQLVDDSKTVVQYEITTLDTSATTMTLAPTASEDGVVASASHTISIPADATLNSVLTVTKP